MPQKNNRFKQLSKEDRCHIERWAKAGKNKSEIARLLGKHRSTIGRQLNNKANKEVINWHLRFKLQYRADLASAHYTNNKKKCGAKLKYFKDDSKALKEVEKRFMASGDCERTRYSLDAIIGRMKLEGLEVFTSKTMYNYIEIGNITTITKFDLPRILGRKKTKKEIDRTNKRILGTSIEQRPEKINNREEFGHFEGDCIVDGSHNAILAKTERLSKLFVLRKLQKHNSESVEKMEAQLKGKYYELSCTYDNGSEFYKRAEHDSEEYISYFTHPSSPYEKGGTENNNGIARRYWPKGTNLADISDKEIQRVEDRINDMPRKILGYKTAREVYNEEHKKVLEKTKAA
jgi:IS30 family transposase